MRQANRRWDHQTKATTFLTKTRRKVLLKKMMLELPMHMKTRRQATQITNQFFIKSNRDKKKTLELLSNAASIDTIGVEGLLFNMTLISLLERHHRDTKLATQRTRDEDPLSPASRRGAAAESKGEGRLVLWQLGFLHNDGFMLHTIT